MSKKKSEFMKLLKSGQFCPEPDEFPNLYDMEQIDEFITNKIDSRIKKQGKQKTVVYVYRSIDGGLFLDAMLRNENVDVDEERTGFQWEASFFDDEDNGTAKVFEEMMGAARRNSDT